MNSLKWIILTLLVCQLSYSRSQVFEADIQYVSLKDSLLIHTIDSLIQYENKTDSLFSKGIGYFLLSIDQSVKKGIGSLPDRIDTVFQYTLMKSYGHPDSEVNGVLSFYPPYFSIIRNRLISIQFSELTGDNYSFSEKSKEMYLKYVKNNVGTRGDESRRFLWNLDYSYDIFYLKNTSSGKYLSPVIIKTPIKVSNK